MDIFVKYPVGEEYQWTISSRKPVLKGVPLKYYDNHTRIEFDGHQYMAPEEFEGFLEYCYGDWRTPVKDWDFRTGDNCVKEIYNTEE